MRHKWTSVNRGGIFRYRRLSGSSNGNVKLVLLERQKYKRWDDVFEDNEWIESR